MLKPTECTFLLRYFQFLHFSSFSNLEKEFVMGNSNCTILVNKYIFIYVHNSIIQKTHCRILRAGKQFDFIRLTSCWKLYELMTCNSCCYIWYMVTFQILNWNLKFSTSHVYLSQYIAKAAQHKRPGKSSLNGNHVCPVDCPGSTVRSMPRRSL